MIYMSTDSILYSMFELGKVVKKLSGLVLAALVLPACSSKYASNGENLYLNSKNGTKIVVPPPLTSANISGFYDLPPQTQDARVSIVPPDKVNTRG